MQPTPPQATNARDSGEIRDLAPRPGLLPRRSPLDQWFPSQLLRIVNCQVIRRATAGQDGSAYPPGLRCDDRRDTSSQGGKLMETYQHARVSDQHPRSQETIVNRSLRTRLDDEPEATSRRVLDILDELSPQPPLTMRCLNPECQETCDYPARGSRGHRPSRFCSKTCRAGFGRTRARLSRELAILQNLATTRSWSKRELTDLQRQMSVRRWVLTRYPGGTPTPS